MENGKASPEARKNSEIDYLGFGKALLKIADVSSNSDDKKISKIPIRKNPAAAKSRRAQNFPNFSGVPTTPNVNKPGAVRNDVSTNNLSHAGDAKLPGSPETSPIDRFQSNSLFDGFPSDGNETFPDIDVNMVENKCRTQTFLTTPHVSRKETLEMILQNRKLLNDLFSNRSINGKFKNETNHQNGIKNDNDCTNKLFEILIDYLKKDSEKTNGDNSHDSLLENILSENQTDDTNSNSSNETFLDQNVSTCSKNGINYKTFEQNCYETKSSSSFEETNKENKEHLPNSELNQTFLNGESSLDSINFMSFTSDIEEENDEVNLQNNNHIEAQQATRTLSTVDVKQELKSIEYQTLLNTNNSIINFDDPNTETNHQQCDSNEGLEQISNVFQINQQVEIFLHKFKFNSNDVEKSLFTNKTDLATCDTISNCSSMKSSVLTSCWQNKENWMGDRENLNLFGNEKKTDSFENEDVLLVGQDSSGFPHLYVFPFDKVGFQRMSYGCFLKANDDIKALRENLSEYFYSEFNIFQIQFRDNDPKRFSHLDYITGSNLLQAAQCSMPYLQKIPIFVCSRVTRLHYLLTSNEMFYSQYEKYFSTNNVFNLEAPKVKENIDYDKCKGKVENYSNNQQSYITNNVFDYTDSQIMKCNNLDDVSTTDIHLIKNMDCTEEERTLSLSLKASLASAESEITILEAPEEFRSSKINEKLHVNDTLLEEKLYDSLQLDSVEDCGSSNFDSSTTDYKEIVEDSQKNGNNEFCKVAETLLKLLKCNGLIDKDMGKTKNVGTLESKKLDDNELLLDTKQDITREILNDEIENQEKVNDGVLDIVEKEIVRTRKPQSQFCLAENKKLRILKKNGLSTVDLFLLVKMLIIEEFANSKNNSLYKTRLAELLKKKLDDETKKLELNGLNETESTQEECAPEPLLSSLSSLFGRHAVRSSAEEPEETHPEPDPLDEKAAAGDATDWSRPGQRGTLPTSGPTPIEPRRVTPGRHAAPSIAGSDTRGSEAAMPRPSEAGSTLSPRRRRATSSIGASTAPGRSRVPGVVTLGGSRPDADTSSTTSWSDGETSESDKFANAHQISGFSNHAINDQNNLRSNVNKQISSDSSSLVINQSASSFSNCEINFVDDQNQSCDEIFEGNDSLSSDTQDSLETNLTNFKSSIENFFGHKEFLSDYARNNEFLNVTPSEKLEDSAETDGTISWKSENAKLIFETYNKFNRFLSERNNKNKSDTEIVVTNCFDEIIVDESLSHVESHHDSAWNYKNGKLVFEIADAKNLETESCDSPSASDCDQILSSKELNRRVDGSFRLKYIEEKLKEAGLTDLEQKTKGENDTSYDSNQNIVKTCEQIDARTTTTIEGQDTVEFCEFDVRQVGDFSQFNGFCEVYDELEENCSDSDDDNNTDCLIVRRSRKETEANMGTDSDRPKHNPDVDNLKSLLKRPGRNKEKKSNRVMFDEKKNEFFDADYIILIREECEFDEEEDDGVCTCTQHEMVRLTCCEPNCSCTYDGYDPTPQSPKFAPPLEFVDAVTLSPPEGYKDMELGEQQLLALQQMARKSSRGAVCKECSATHEEIEDGEASQSDEDDKESEEGEENVEKEKTDQSQQTTPTTPTSESNGFSDTSIVPDRMTGPSEQNARQSHKLSERDAERKLANCSPVISSEASTISGILKGGKLWKQQSLDNGNSKFLEPQQSSDSSLSFDDETTGRRSVRFVESSPDSNEREEGCDGAPDTTLESEKSKSENPETTKPPESSNSSPESNEMLLTFKLGNHVLISNNSLKPNSAVRQLFPCTKSLCGKEDESIQQYLVTAESLKAFDEAKKSKLPQIIQNGETDESIKKAIERNTLRRSLIRYEPRPKKNLPKTDNSLVERIKQLTCDVDNEEEIPLRSSPPGEEAKTSLETSSIKHSFSPSSSSSASSNSSTSSTYKKITDLFSKKEKPIDSQNNIVNFNELKISSNTMPDLGNGHENPHLHLPISKSNSINESRKQFLSTLAPLTACVGGVVATDEYYYSMNPGAERNSLSSSSVGTEFSLEDIDEALKNVEEENKKIAPDVLAGTPSASESGDELAMFVQQDAGRIERLKKKYHHENKKDDDDEHNDYGFNKRPSVRGIKPRFSSTTEIIQQIQGQMQPPPIAQRLAWPYYSESGLSNVIDNSKLRNANIGPSYQPNLDEIKVRDYNPNLYRPTSLQDEHMLMNSAQQCSKQYRINGNMTMAPPAPYPGVVKVDAKCNEYYQSLPRQRNGRPQSPPPMDMSKAFHQTMVYIPYNHIEGYQPVLSPNPYYVANDYRVNNQNHLNKRYAEPIYQQRVHVEDHQYHPALPPKQNFRASYHGGTIPPSHLVPARSESPVSSQFSTARSTQTPSAPNYYSSTARYRSSSSGGMWQNDPTYANKINRHSFPRYAPSDLSISSTESQTLSNGYRQSVEISFSTHQDTYSAGSPTKTRFIERGVPEGAASVSPQDNTGISQATSGTMTSPTSPQGSNLVGTAGTAQKPLFYAMNV